MAGTLFVVATPIGNLEDITLRAIRVLKEAALVAAEDTRRTGNLLRHLGLQTPLLSLHEHNEQARIAGLLRRLQQGDDVALVSDAGTPGVSDPGTRIIAAAVEAGITVVPVPGPSAVLAALTGSGLAWDRFRFVGFPPIKAKDRKLWLQDLAEAREASVAFEAPHRIRKTLAEIASILGDRPIIVARELTKVHEEFLRGPAAVILDRLETPRGEFTLVFPPAETPVDSGEKPSDEQISLVLGEITKQSPASRRASLRQTAEKLGLSVKDVYAAVERHKGRVP